MVRIHSTPDFKNRIFSFVLYTSVHREEGPRFERGIAQQTLPSANSKKSILGSYFSKQLILKHDTEKYNM